MLPKPEENCQHGLSVSTTIYNNETKNKGTLRKKVAHE
jgi:hypothetical protein